MKLSTRLIFLMLGCLLPILTAQVYSQVDLNSVRQAQLSGLVLRQAELTNSDIGSIINTVAQLGAVVVRLPEVAGAGPECGSRLETVRQDLPQYRFLAIYALDGELLCGSAMAPRGIAAGHREWFTEFATAVGAQTGPLMPGSNSAAAFLPIGMQISGAATGSDPRVLVVGLDADWFARHLETVRLDHSLAVNRTTLSVVDRDGIVVARVPDSTNSVGQPLSEWEKRLASREAHGVTTATDTAGHDLVAAYVPAASSPSGLAVLETVAVHGVTADINHATYQDLLVIAAAAVVALILAWVAGRRFIYRPTEALLLAARKWREGDLSARATLSNAGSEFAALGQSFNAMAAGLQAREMERRMQASFLEAQVVERTRELSESNNRLQVEIAGREKSEAALHQAQKLQAVGQLAGGIAHDFNNMLATVLGNLELMERRVSQTEREWVPSDAERFTRLIGRASGAVQRGSQLTARLLAFSRRQRLTARLTDVNALLGELITLATSTLGRGVQVVPELADELWPAMVDPSQVEAAILALCLNARDAMPQGGSLTISTANVAPDSEPEGGPDEPNLPPGGFVRICVADTGVGMTAEVKAQAFNPFFTTKGPHGSGLGLSQVYGMARQSGGNVIIDSEPGEGTRVTLFLPRATQAERTEAAPIQTSTSRAAASSMPPDLVLVVDDDTAVRQVTVEMTRDLGCEVAQAAGGEQALALIETLSPPPALILLDYAMPGMNGLQLARALRDRGISAPIALVTGYAELSETDVAEAQLAGLLRKPFTIGELYRLLSQLRAIAAAQLAVACLEPGLLDG